MTDKDAAEVSGWIKYQTTVGMCPFCSSEQGSMHRPFCTFDRGTHIVHSEHITRDVSEWKEGFFDALKESRRARKNPVYLLGNIAGRKKQNLNQSQVVA